MYVRAISEVTFVFELHSKSEIRTFRKGCEDGTLKAGGNWKSEKGQIPAQASSLLNLKVGTIGSILRITNTADRAVSPHLKFY